MAVDTSITPDLAEEGLARELVHRIQNLRRAANFEITDRINTYYRGPEKVARIMKGFADYIQQETLSAALVDGEPVDGAPFRDSEGGGCGCGAGGPEDLATASQCPYWLGLSSRVTSRVRSRSSRKTFSSTVPPTLWSNRSILIRSRTVETAFPPMDTITSPPLAPACQAGPSVSISASRHSLSYGHTYLHG